MNAKFSDIKPDHAFGIKASNPMLNFMQKYDVPKRIGTKIATANNMGFMKSKLDIFSQSFVSFAKKQAYPVLEIGACYGTATLCALKGGATVIANDIAEEHLSIIYQKTSAKYLNKLYLNLKYFPSQTEFEENTLGAVLACRVFHFLKGKEVDYGFKKIHKWLVPGGKFYFVTLSPHHSLLKENFLPIYERNYQANKKWPGIINNMHKYNPTEKDYIPNFLHVFDEEKLVSLLANYNFKIEKITKYNFDGKNFNQGYVGFVAQKS